MSLERYAQGRDDEHRWVGWFASGMLLVVIVVFGALKLSGVSLVSEEEQERDERNEQLQGHLDRIRQIQESLRASRERADAAQGKRDRGHALRATRREFAESWKSGNPADAVAEFVAEEHRERLRADFEAYVKRRGKEGVPPLFPPGEPPDATGSRVEDSFQTDDWVPATFRVVWSVGSHVEIVDWTLPSR